MFEKIKYYIKKWLGMAIAYKTTPEESSKNIFIIRENFKIKMKQLTNKDIVNKNNGIVARIKGILSAVEKTDKPNPTTKKQISQEQKKQAHLAREAGIKKSLDLLQKKQSKSADTAVSNISSDSIKNETKPKFRKMLQRKDNINNKDKK